MNGCGSRKFNMKNLLYINVHPCTHRKNARFINIFRCSLFSANCSFEEHSNDKDLFMKNKASIFVVVHAIRSLSLGDELLINYKFRRPTNTHQIRIALGLPLDIPLGRKKKFID